MKRWILWIGLIASQSAFAKMPNLSGVYQDVLSTNDVKLEFSLVNLAGTMSMLSRCHGHEACEGERVFVPQCGVEQQPCSYLKNVAYSQMEYVHNDPEGLPWHMELSYLGNDGWIRTLYKIKADDQWPVQTFHLNVPHRNETFMMRRLP